MELKFYIKKVVPSFIKNLRSTYKHKEEIAIYRKELKKIEKEEKITVSPRIAFILQFPETWNSLKKVYEIAEKEKFESIVICVPKAKISTAKEYELPETKVNEAYELLKNQDVNAVKADLAESNWFNLKKFNPDYVFYTRPYNEQYPEPYKSSAVCKYSKICYIPYGFALNKGEIFDISYNPDFLLQTYITFPTSKDSCKLLKRKYFLQYLLKTNKFEYLGFPRFDLYLEKNDFKKEKKDKYTIAWMPRWECNKNAKGQQYSHFLDYYENFIEFVRKNENIKFIFRPHPLMYETIINQKILTKKEVEGIKQKMSNLKNLIVDTEKDYIPTLLKADILIADFTSLLMEYYVMKKPIIFCDKSKNYFKDGKKMDATLYHANSWQDVEIQIKKLLTGNDEKYGIRSSTIEKIGIEKDSSKRIIKYIMNDYKNNEV